MTVITLTKEKMILIAGLKRSSVTLETVADKLISPQAFLVFQCNFYLSPKFFPRLFRLHHPLPTDQAGLFRATVCFYHRGTIC